MGWDGGHGCTNPLALPYSPPRSTPGAQGDEEPEALIALCGSLYRLATDVTMDAIVTFAQQLRREVGESLVVACVRRDPALQRSPAFIR